MPLTLFPEIYYYPPAQAGGQVSVMDSRELDVLLRKCVHGALGHGVHLPVQHVSFAFPLLELLDLLELPEPELEREEPLEPEPLPLAFAAACCR